MLLVLLLPWSVALAEEALTIWCRQPATQWEAALPLGNGRMGAMVFGTAPVERVQLNEESLWAGEPFDVYPDKFQENLKLMQQLVLNGQILEAEQFGIEHLTGEPTSFRSYQPLADLWIEMEHGSELKDYCRELDLRSGMAGVQYRVAGVLLRREALISAVDDVVAVRLTADRPASVNCRVRLTREKDVRTSSSSDTELNMDGQIIDIPAPEGYDDNPGGSGPGGEHMRFAGRLLARPTGGSIRADGESLIVDGADELVLLFTGATDFSLERMNFDRSIDPGALADRILERAAERSWEDIVQDHTAEHQTLFDRVSLDLGESARDALPTDERLAALKRGEDDPGLVELFFQFGRYLLMSSSRRPGRLPANLQGIWNGQMWAPWEADYHLNINLQMNYWPADVCNLSETVDPLADWFARVTEKGKVSARRLYGADGWVAFTTVDLFGRTTPGGSTIKSQFMNGVLDPLAGAWMSLTLWRHYSFGRDESFLRDRAYPILKGAAEFLLDYLVEDGDGHLTIVPSTSPENSYIYAATGQATRVTQGSAYHLTIVRAVFEAVIESSTILGVDDAFRQELEKALARIPPMKIGADGTIQEWYGDFEEREPGHRHMSHLLGLHPFAQITPRTPELFAAARKTIGRRLAHGGGHTGWSRAWLISFCARLLDGDEAYKHLVTFLRGGTHANFLGVDPMLQVDGYLAGAAGVAEMLLQSHAGEIHLLPALPAAWPTGHVHGLRARGGFVVDIDWKDGKLTGGRVHSTAGRPCRLRCSQSLDITTAGTEKLKVRTPEEAVIEFATQRDGLYKFSTR